MKTEYELYDHYDFGKYCLAQLLLIFTFLLFAMITEESYDKDAPLSEQKTGTKATLSIAVILLTALLTICYKERRELPGALLRLEKARTNRHRLISSTPTNDELAERQPIRTAAGAPSMPAELAERQPLLAKRDRPRGEIFELSMMASHSINSDATDHNATYQMEMGF